MEIVSPTAVEQLMHLVTIPNVVHAQPVLYKYKSEKANTLHTAASHSTTIRYVPQSECGQNFDETRKRFAFFPLCGLVCSSKNIFNARHSANREAPFTTYIHTEHCWGNCKKRRRRKTQIDCPGRCRIGFSNIQ